MCKGIAQLVIGVVMLQAKAQAFKTRPGSGIGSRSRYAMCVGELTGWRHLCGSFQARGLAFKTRSCSRDGSCSVARASRAGERAGWSCCLGKLQALRTRPGSGIHCGSVYRGLRACGLPAEVRGFTARLRNRSGGRCGYRGLRACELVGWSRRLGRFQGKALSFKTRPCRGADSGIGCGDL
mmetsp:Transcript_29866/g.85530  ORF Transcript_29866/g.85530 Transcript_29866/m.85530 type:complete len:181 (+) Transcript_29866:1008-1550(+)